MKRETLATEPSFVEIGNLANLNKPDQSAATHASDFAVVLHLARAGERGRQDANRQIVG